jgi:branched-chain amino acid transport system ATP-binding protein
MLRDSRGHGDSLLRIHGLTVRFGGLTALSGIELDVALGETVGIIGPNGSGKTTLLNALTRLATVERGATMSFAGTSLLALRAHQLARIGIARTFQSVEMCSTDSILRGVVMGATRRTRRVDGSAGADRGKRHLEERGAALLDEFGIADWSAAKAQDVPYGVGKRAQICRALMSDPQLLLLDEPASGMTAAEKQQLGLVIAAVQSKLNLSVLIIEHDVTFLASGLCDRLIALDSGHLIAGGTPDIVRRDPRVIAAYLGDDDGEPPADRSQGGTA